MDYVTYDDAGLLTGAYSQDLRDEHAGCFIEISPEQRLQWPMYRANAARDGLELLPAIPPSAEQRNAPILAALEEIDRKSIRALREGDQVRIAAYEADAAALRTQLIKAF